MAAILKASLRTQVESTSKDLPNMNTFCDWLSETIVNSVYDSFFRNYISVVLLSFTVLSSQSKRLFIEVHGDPKVQLQLRSIIVSIRLSEVHTKTGAELVSNGIVGRNLGTKQKVPSQVPSHNAIIDEFGTTAPVFF